MSDTYSVQELNKFLDYLRTKGLMKPATVAARKAAVNKVLGILTADETKDVRAFNLDDVVMRFANLKGSGFKPESIRVYKSRVSASIADFVEYRKNPVTFKPSGSGQRDTASVKREKDQKASTANNKNEPQHASEPEVSEVIFPIPLRPNLVIKLVGVPGDLTKREASKIANVVMALAQDIEK
jgi:site-specific recombinase XerC